MGSKPGLIMVSEMGAANYTDLKSAQGTVLIAAPTAVIGPTNQGVWFINPSTKAFSLELPARGANQAYEGWIVDDCTGKKASTELFRANGAIDSDSEGRYAGPLAHNFHIVPGSDFVKLGQDLADGKQSIVIIVEPYPESDPNPSGIVVLRVSQPE